MEASKIQIYTHWREWRLQLKPKRQSEASERQITPLLAGEEGNILVKLFLNIIISI